ncbi:hypothetical protein BDW71DRAFT_39055 [Aspergillus fruticulosus]
MDREMIAGLEKKGRLEIMREGLEHIGRPGCENMHRYSGSVLLEEQFNRARTLQSLVRKPRHWRPAGDVHDIERSTDFYLSGICNVGLGPSQGVTFDTMSALPSMAF